MCCFFCHFQVNTSSKESCLAKRGFCVSINKWTDLIYIENIYPVSLNCANGPSDVLIQQGTVLIAVLQYHHRTVQKFSCPLSVSSECTWKLLCTFNCVAHEDKGKLLSCTFICVVHECKWDLPMRAAQECTWERYMEICMCF